MTTYKIAILGDRNVGKSTFVARHATGHFLEADALSVDSYKVNINTNYGRVCLEFKPDVTKADAAIFMFDLTSPKTMTSIKERLPGLSDTFFVVCGNKSDSSRRVVTSKVFRTNFIELQMPLFEISAKSNYNYDKPFLVILRHLMGHDDLVLM